MKNKKIYVRIVIGIIAVALIATGILVFNSIKKERERVALAISEQSNYINSEVEIFNTRTNYNDQYLDFDTILTEYEAYKNQDETFDEVINLYDETIASMKATIKGSYDKAFASLVIADFATSTDDLTLAGSISNTNLVLQDVTNQKDKVGLTDEEYQNYVTNVNAQNTSYQARIDEITAQRAAEEAAKKTSKKSSGSVSSGGSSSIRYVYDENGNVLWTYDSNDPLYNMH